MICFRIRTKWRSISFRIPRGGLDVLPVLSCHVETVCLWSKLNVDRHIEVEINLDEMDLTAASPEKNAEQFSQGLPKSEDSTSVCRGHF